MIKSHVAHQHLINLLLRLNRKHSTTWPDQTRKGNTVTTNISTCVNNHHSRLDRCAKESNFSFGKFTV